MNNYTNWYSYFKKIAAPLPPVDNEYPPEDTEEYTKGLDKLNLAIPQQEAEQLYTRNMEFVKSGDYGAVFTHTDNTIKKLTTHKLEISNVIEIMKIQKSLGNKPIPGLVFINSIRNFKEYSEIIAEKVIPLSEREKIVYDLVYFSFLGGDAQYHKQLLIQNNQNVMSHIKKYFKDYKTVDKKTQKFML